MRRWTFIVLVPVVLSLVGCGGPPPEAFGLSLSSQGDVEVRFGRCLGAMSIWVQPAGDKWIPPLWHVVPKTWRAASPLPPAIVVGDVPPDWRAVTELRHPLQPGLVYRVDVSSGESYAEDFDFTLADLKPGYVLDFTHDVVPEDEFPTESACPTKSPSSPSPGASR